MEAKIQEMTKGAKIIAKTEKLEVPVMPLFMLINNIGELEDHAKEALLEAGASEKMITLYKSIIELSKDADYLENII